MALFLDLEILTTIPTTAATTLETTLVTTVLTTLMTTELTTERYTTTADVTTLSVTDPETQVRVDWTTDVFEELDARKVMF